MSVRTTGDVLQESVVDRCRHPGRVLLRPLGVHAGTWGVCDMPRAYPRQRSLDVWAICRYPPWLLDGHTLGFGGNGR